VRGGIVKIDKFEVVPGDAPGVEDDLKDTVEDAVVAAVYKEGSIIYAFGAKWGPVPKKDKYFKFVASNGIHDIHMNQGKYKWHAGDDGIYHDGCGMSFPIAKIFRDSSISSAGSKPSLPANCNPSLRGARRARACQRQRVVYLSSI
jgi:hypothetical protein